MGILTKSLSMLEKCGLCNHCLGRQFALLGHGIENDERGHAIKLALTLKAHDLALSKSRKGIAILKTLATNGFFKPAEQVLQKMKSQTSAKAYPKTCFLCEDKFEICDRLTEKALSLLDDFEHCNFLVGIELPVPVAEREDEFKARFEVSYGESLRNEFGRTIGKKISEHTGKTAEFKKPEIVVLVNPFAELVTLQVNPLFIAGRYKKIVRGIPQSKWYCSNCWGKGCERCNWTGKLYQESVQEIIEKPFLDVTGGAKSSFHASGREDIDVRMLGRGRPFVIEISQPQKRFLDLKKLEEAVNVHGKGKVEVLSLKLADKDVVRKLKKGESTQKEYRVLIEFEKRITAKAMRVLEESLKNAVIRQQTPLRVLHRRADLTREKYIYGLNVKKLSLKKAEVKILCQGGLYVKELVTGDEGRTVPSISEILKNKAKPMKLDVLSVIMEEC
jgi:tRNA pseudouridine synthase 10